MLPFSAIYFDTNSFIEGGWPIPNTQLRNVLSFAGETGVSVFLLKPVEDELEEHWVREFDNAVGRTKIPKVLDGIGIQHDLQIPDREMVRNGYRRAAENAVMIWAIQRGPATSKSLTDLYGMAIRHQRPFVEGGRGFQDAVIAFSAIEHAATREGKACAFVSQDGAFDQACLDRLAGPLGVRIWYFRDLNQLLVPLSQELTQKVRESWSAANEQAVLAISKNLKAVEQFIYNNLEIPDTRGVFFGKLLQVKKITIEKIVGASTPFPFDRRLNEAFTFLADIEIGIHAVVKRYGSSSLFQALLATKRFKAGSEVAAATPAPFPASLEPGLPDEVLRDEVEVEFTAYCRDLDIERVEPKSVRFKSG